jgi:hypothetical protein
MLQEMVAFYGGRYLDKMLSKSVYSSIGRRMMKEYPDIEREAGTGLHGYSALTRELSAKLRTQR